MGIANQRTARESLVGDAHPTSLRIGSAHSAIRSWWAMPTLLFVVIVLLAQSSLDAAEPAPAFTAAGGEFRFDTGVLRGALREKGKALGLTSVTAGPGGQAMAGQYGLLSHYRLLDADNRYGTAAWDWRSEARLLPDGAVEVRWKADEQHPFDMTAVYRWATPGAVDVATTVTAQRRLPRFEVFLASYFAGFPSSLAYVAPQGEKPRLFEATQAEGAWQTFPRDDEAAKIFADGRWKRPPHPVDWKTMPRLASPLAIRRDAASGWTAVLMSPPSDCFAISMPYGEESHRSVYLSLFGKDLAAGQSATAHARLAFGRGIDDEQAVALYRQYLGSRSGVKSP